MKDFLTSYISESGRKKDLYIPEFFRLGTPEGRQRLEQLLSAEKGIMVTDEILGQVEELVKSRNPKTVFKKSGLTEAAKSYLGNRPWEEHGVWVYYPWSKRLVHMLDEEEFVEVRTNRNQYKITPEERDLLAAKKVGIIGLSVGQSVAMTMAMERSFGELRIADFDILELSNLNRIRSGTHNLGISKVVMVAREIAEIDPYLKVTCFNDGLTEENLETFLTGGGKLDVLIEECDSLNIKVTARLRARELRIPVVMDTSDKGMLDVERFDLEPARPILHGLIDHLDFSELKHLKTNEEKVPYVLPIIGVDTISKRMKASMLEIEQTVTTWPQLSSAVTLGGGITADVCRRIMLNQFTGSGRYFVDLEEIIGDKEKKKSSGKPEQAWTPPEGPAPLTDEDIQAILRKTKLPDMEGAQGVPAEVVRQLVESACLAPTGGNCQPWKWVNIGSSLLLFHELSHSFSFLDFQHAGSYVGFGAAIENLALKAHALNVGMKVHWFPGQDTRLVAFIELKQGANKGENIPAELVKYIPDRITDRTLSRRTRLDDSSLAEIKKACESVSGARLQYLLDEKSLNEIEDILAIGEKIRFMHPWAHYDFYNKEFRRNKEENLSKRDGLDIETFELTASEKAGLLVASDPEVIKYLNKWKGGDGFERLTRKSIQAASGVGLVSMPGDDTMNYLQGGRAVERAWLAATKCKVAFQPVSALLFMFLRMQHGGQDVFEPAVQRTLNDIKERFSRVFPSEGHTGQIFLFRLFKGEKHAVKSLRRPLEEVFKIYK